MCVVRGRKKFPTNLDVRSGATRRDRKGRGAAVAMATVMATAEKRGKANPFWPISLARKEIRLNINGC